MALAIRSKHFGTVRFYVEPKRNGGGLIAVFPKSLDDTPGKRECFVNSEGMYEEVDAAYLRNLRTADGDDSVVRATAEFIVGRVDYHHEYAESIAPLTA